MSFLTTASVAGKEYYVEYAASEETKSDAPIDMHRVLKSGNLPDTVSDKSGVAQALLSVNSWMPYAAEMYGTSPSLNDYVVTPTTIFLTDIPNANLAAFPFEECSAWNPTAGRISYRTWKGKPCHEEHANQDPTAARGIIFDASMKPVPNYIGGLHRVVLLAGWDRNKFPELAGRIQEDRHGFSMGAWVADYNCSVCNASMRGGGCCHIHPQRGVMLGCVGNKLVYRIARGVTGFELSAVKSPAWRNAYGQAIG